MQSQYDSYSEGGTGGYDNIEIRIGTYNTLEFDLIRAFKSGGQYGQSLGVAIENVALVDGALYIDPEKGVLKTFSWEEVTGFTPQEALENDEEPSADDAPEVLPKTYGDTKKRYALVAARVASDEDAGIESSSVQRDYEWVGEDDVEFGEFVDREGELCDLGYQEFISWYDGTQENGPTVTATRLVTVLTQPGEDLILNEDDIFTWLDGENPEGDILREDLEGRRVRFFIVRRQSDESEYSYNFPVIVDAKTGVEVEPNNREETESSGDSGNL